MSIVYNTSIIRDGLVLNFDGANPKSFSPNIHPKPLDVYAWVAPGGAYQMTLSRETSFTSPAGGQPLKIVTTGTSGPYTSTYNNSSWNLAPAVLGQTWTFSFWVKGSSNFSASAMIFGANTSGGYVELGQPSYNVTTDWTRVSGSYTLNSPSTAFVQFRFDVYVNGVTMWVDGLQIERASSVSSFSSITNTNGSTFYDLSGSNNTGNLTNFPSYSSGAFTFNGSNSNASVTNSTSLKNNAITIDLWLKNNGSINGDIVQFGVGSGNYAQYYLRSYSSNTYWDWFPTNTPYYGEAALANSNFQSGVWKHLVLTGSNDGSVQMFLNTNSVGGPVRNSTPAQTSWTPANLTIGGYTWDGFTTLSISSVKIYNRVLSTSEISQNFNALRDRYGI